MASVVFVKGPPQSVLKFIIVFYNCVVGSAEVSILHAAKGIVGYWWIPIELLHAFLCKPA